MKQSITRLGIAAALLVSVFAARAPDPSPVAASTAPPASPSETLTLVRLQAAQAAAQNSIASCSHPVCTGGNPPPFWTIFFLVLSGLSTRSGPHLWGVGGPYPEE
jgi:hypothetical protein